MAITVEVKPDLSRFRQASAEEIANEIGCELETARKLLEHYTVLPG